MCVDVKATLPSSGMCTGIIAWHGDHIQVVTASTGCLTLAEAGSDV